MHGFQALRAENRTTAEGEFRGERESCQLKPFQTEAGRMKREHTNLDQFDIVFRVKINEELVHNVEAEDEM